MKLRLLFFAFIACFLALTQGAKAQTVTLTASAGDSICAGVADTFTATATGFGAHAFRWYVNSRPVPRDTTNTYIPRRLNNGDSIWVVVTNIAGDTVLAASDTIVMVIVYPPRPMAITGADSLCVGDTVRLMDSSVGGVWGTTNTALASVTATGLVYGLAPTPPRGAGVSITYKLTGTCGSDSAVLRLRIDRPASVIVGVTELCKDSTTLYTDSTRGVWTVSDTNIANFVFRNVLQAFTTGTVKVYFNAVNTCGSYSDSLSLNVVNCDTTTGVAPLNTTSSLLSVYPNPATASCFISVGNAGNDAVLTVVDMKGTLVMSQNIGSTKQVAFSAAPGVYLATVTTGTNSEHARVVITE